MKRITWLLAAAAPIYLVSCQKDVRTSEPTTVSMARAETGNGAPSGAHYNLNIIGVPRDKTADKDGNTGGRIFVPLGKNSTSSTKIKLTEAPAGEGFSVLDANGTDRDGAKFQLPGDVSENWTVWARVPGNQKGTAEMTTCAEETWDGTQLEVNLCTNSLSLNRLNYGKFRDVSDELLYVTLTIDILDQQGNTITAGTPIPLFDDALQGYFWQYDNNGLKLLQLRFYPM